jgi:hypothetical protein
LPHGQDAKSSTFGKTAIASASAVAKATVQRTVPGKPSSGEGREEADIEQKVAEFTQ